MPIHLSRKLLALAASVGEDGGEAVRRTLCALVSEAAPFDAGEVVLRHEGRLARWGLGASGEGEGLAAEDLLASLLSVGAALRFDDWEEMAAFPAMEDRLRALDLRSLLALPLVPAEHGSGGALIVARRQGWAFVGASLPELEPMAGMAGMALTQALSATALRRRMEALEAGLSAGGSGIAALRRELLTCREEREAALRAAAEARSRLEAEEARDREREARREQAQSRQELDSARAELREARALAAIAGTGRDAALADVRDRELRLAELEVRLEELAGLREALLAEVERKRGELQQRDAEVHFLRQELQASREELSVARPALASAAPADTAADLHRLRQEATRREEEAQSLRRDLASAREELASARGSETESRAALEALVRARDLESRLGEAAAAREALRAEIERRAAEAKPKGARTRGRKKQPRPRKKKARSAAPRRRPRRRTSADARRREPRPRLPTGAPLGRRGRAKRARR